jgi:hypothetical protein
MNPKPMTSPYQRYVCTVCFKHHGFFCDTEVDPENPDDNDFSCICPGKSPIWTKSKIPARCLAREEGL